MTRPDLFNFVIGSLLYGATMDELSEKLHECVEASRETGKVSTLTLDREVTLMFGTPEGNLVREDPRQMKLDLRRVDGPPAGELRKVNP